MRSKHDNDDDEIEIVVVNIEIELSQVMSNSLFVIFTKTHGILCRRVIYDCGSSTSEGLSIWIPNKSLSICTKQEFASFYYDF